MADRWGQIESEISGGSDLWDNGLAGQILLADYLEPPPTVPVLAIQSAGHSHASTQPTLAPRSALTSAAAVHAHSATSPALTPRAALVVASAAHAHTSTQPTLLPRSALLASASTHAHVATSPTLASIPRLAGADAAHAVASTSPALLPRSTLAANDNTHAHSADVVVLVPRSADPPAEERVLRLGQGDPRLASAAARDRVIVLDLLSSTGAVSGDAARRVVRAQARR